MLRFRVRISMDLLFLALIFTFFISQPAAAQGPQDKDIFLPFMVKGTSTTPPPPPPPVQGAFFIQPDVKTDSAAIAVDKQGGKHLAYYYFVPTTPHPGEDPADHPAAVYLYCPGLPTDCADPDKWTGVAMLDKVNEVQLALTPAGQPRLLIRVDSTQPLQGLSEDYYYAACDQNCTQPGNWSLTYLVTTSGMAAFEVYDQVTPQRSFALDSEGRPRFVYLDGTAGHRGTFYAYCDQGCTDPANWFETAIHRGDDPWYESYYYPSLAFTDQDQPRVVADGNYVLAGNPQGIYYLACDTNCELSSSWQRTYLFERGSGIYGSWDLEMAGNQPRLAFYEGDQLGEAGEILYYAWCNSNCLSQAGWQRHYLGFGSTSGKHPDLELDAQGRPRLAYVLQNGLGVGYAWCDNGCESTQGQWHNQAVDLATALEVEYPVARPTNCDAGLWDLKNPVLELDGSGNPFIAYDGGYKARCWYDDPLDNQPPGYVFWQLWHSVRVKYFPKP